MSDFKGGYKTEVARYELIPEERILFENKNIGIAYSNQWIFNEKNKKRRIHTNKVLPKGDISFKIFQGPPVHILTAVIKKEEYFNLRIGFNKKYQIIGDYDFFVRI